MWQAPHPSTVPQSLLKFTSVESVIQSNHLILCCLLLLLPSIFPGIRVFSSELTLHMRQPKYWNISLSNSTSNEYSGLIFFKIDWFNLFAVQRVFSSAIIQKHQLKNNECSLKVETNDDKFTDASIALSLLWVSIFHLVF